MPVTNIFVPEYYNVWLLVRLISMNEEYRYGAREKNHGDPTGSEALNSAYASDNPGCKGMSLVDVDKKVLRIFSEQIFHTGFVHADPHPGNMMIRCVNNKPQIVLLGKEFLPYC